MLISQEYYKVAFLTKFKKAENREFCFQPFWRAQWAYVLMGESSKFVLVVEKSRQSIVRWSLKEGGAKGGLISGWKKSKSSCGGILTLECYPIVSKWLL